MDFGVVGLDNFVCSNSGTSASNNGSFALQNATESSKQKWYGSGCLKQERTINEDDFRDFKVAKSSSCGEAMLKIPLQRSNSSSLIDGHHQMLSFSSPNSHTVTLPYYHHTSTAFSRNTGYGSTGINAASMLSGIRGPFTPSQWMELEHQALIYKYITANVPIPSYLLNPIRKAFESAGFSSFSSLRSNSLGWGAFHLGFSNNDPEPGRCRRTDGKKWRCSRDAVADQKYCERHMNRGRHRSRKPVEGQSGHSASSKPTPIASSTTSASAVPAGGPSNNLGLSHHHHHPSGIPNINRNLLDKENSSSHQEFGLVCSDSLLNPLNKSSSLVNCKNFSTSDKSQHSLRQFMDDWPKNHSDRSSMSWPDIDLQPDRTTQLSISIPIVTSDFMSSTSSPMSEKIKGSSPLRLSQELEMGLGVGTSIITSEKQTNWVPISWEPSIGGPLGEVLHNSTSESKNSKPLNLMDSWDNSPRLASSPTGVLQRGAFGSLSNSSAGSSPRAESSGLMNPSLPAL